MAKLLQNETHVLLSNSNVSTQPLVVRGAVVMVAHRGICDSQASQQDPVQFTLHQADAKESELGIVQGDGVHRMKRVCKSCRKQYPLGARTLPGLSLATA